MMKTNNTHRSSKQRHRRWDIRRSRSSNIGHGDRINGYDRLARLNYLQSSAVSLGALTAQQRLLLPYQPYVVV